MCNIVLSVSQAHYNPEYIPIGQEGPAVQAELVKMPPFLLGCPNMDDKTIWSPYLQMAGPWGPGTVTSQDHCNPKARAP